jgi:hypothetical protein
VHRLSRILLVLSLALLGIGCGASKPAVQVAPPPPEPPREPMAWLPEDVTLIGRVQPGAFQGSPLYALWNMVLGQRAAQGALVDPAKITHATFAGKEDAERKPSFVVALYGAFGAGSVEAAAKAAGLAPEPQGLLTFYRRERVAYAQVYDDLVLVCSLDRVEALGARAAQGPEIKVLKLPLFQSLAGRVVWDNVHLALLGEDPSGEIKARAQRMAERVGYELPIKDLLRAGLGLTNGPSPALTVVGQSADDAQAGVVRGGLERTLDSLGGNMLVALVGLRTFVKSLHVTQDASFVTIAGSLAADEFNGAMVRLLGLVGIEAADVAVPPS